MGSAMYLGCAWMFYQAWIVYFVKVFITGDFTPRPPTSYEDKSAPHDGLQAEEDDEEKDYAADYVPQRNSALAIFKKLGAVIRRTHVSDFKERWAIRTITVGFLLYSAQQDVSFMHAQLIRRPQYYTLQFVIPLILYQLYEMPKLAGRPLAFHYSVEGRKPIILNDTERMFYMNVIGCITAIVVSYFKNESFLFSTDANMPTINMAIMTAGCVTTCNVCYLLSKQYVDRQVYGWSLVVSSVLGCIFFYSALPQQRIPVICLYVGITAVGHMMLIVRDKRGTTPGQTLVGT